MADYSGRLLRLGLAEFAARIPPGDPRRDPWTEGLERWFEARAGAQSRELWYVHAGLLDRVRPRAFLAGLQSRSVAELGEAGAQGLLGSPALRLILALGALAGLFALRGLSRRLAAAGALPWLLFIVAAPPPAAFLGFGGLALLAPAAQRLAPFFLGPGEEALPPAGSLGIASALLLLPPLYAALLVFPEGMGSCLALSFASLAALLLVGSLRKGRGRPHFVALPIGGRRGVLGEGLRALPPALRLGGLLVLLLAALPLVAGAGGRTGSGDSSLLLPLPLGAGRESPLEPLPGLPAYRSHLGNEAGFFDGALREEGEGRLGRADEGRAAPARAASFGRGDIESLLAEAGAKAVFGLAPLSEGRARPLALWRLLLYIIAPILAFAASFGPPGALRRSTGHHP